MTQTKTGKKRLRSAKRRPWDHTRELDGYGDGKKNSRRDHTARAMEFYGGT